MDANLLLIALSACSAFGLAAACAGGVYGWWRRRRRVLEARGAGVSAGSLAEYTLQEGVAPFLPLARRLESLAPLKTLGRELESLAFSKGVSTTPTAALSVLLAAGAVVALLTLVLTCSFVAALAVTACLFAVAFALGAQGRDRQIAQVREEVPDVLELMSACFDSGFTLMQTFQQISCEIPGRLGALFGRSAHVLEIGGSADEALTLLRKEDSVDELSFVIAALDVQHRSGGSLKSVLARAARSVKDELALKRSLQVQTAQAKLSARIVTVMPFLLLAVFSLVSPDFLQPFFQSVLGVGLLVLALVMEAVGIFLVQRCLSVGGVS